MRRFLNNRISNYNNVGDKVDDFCEDCENRWLPFSRVWWDSTEKNIADIKRKDNGIFVIKKILSLINSISESIKDIYDRINAIEPPTLSEKLIELENDYLEVGVTADDKQEDLNIAIYENYISLKNTKVDKPLIESTSDSLKIVALDNQGESVFIKSNELGKVKSVNNKIGDVILKTSDLENDSDYTTNLKLNQERDERISGDNLKLDKPTTSGTITTHPNIVGVDDLGNSAKLKATDFGKVKSVNGKEGDVILKTSDLENNSDYTTNAILTAHTSNKANPHNVTKSQIGLGNVDNTSDLNKPISTATQIELNKKINKPTTNNTPDYVLLADGSTAPKSDFGKVDKVMGVSPDVNKNVDISGVAMNWTNAQQRMSALVSKHNDATYNRLLGMDSQGNLNEVGIYALTNTMKLATPSQRVALMKEMNGQYSSGQITTSLILKPIIKKTTNDGYTIVRIIGTNLLIDPDTSYVNIKDKNNTVIFSSCKFINSTSEELLVYVPNSFIEANKEYVFDIKHGIQLHTTFEYVSVVDALYNYDLNNINFTLTNNPLNIDTPVLDTVIDYENKKITNRQILYLEPTDPRFYKHYQKVKTNQFATPSDNFIVELNIDWGYGTGPWDVYQKTYDIIGLSKYKNITDVNDTSDNTITGIMTGYKGNNNGGDETRVINGGLLYLSGLFTLLIIKQDTRFITILEHQSGQILFKKQTAVITEGFSLEFLFPTRSLPITIGKYSINSIQKF